MEKSSDSLTEFGLDLFKGLSEKNKNENIFFSPLSISFALGMTFAGCRNNTREEMRKVMHLEKEQDHQLHQFFQKLRASLFSENKNFTLLLANRLYAQEDFFVEKEFLDICDKFYRSHFMSVNFKTQSAETCKMINNHVEDMTNKKITNLISKDSVNALTKLIIINAIYFKGDWNTKFKEENTKEDDFHVSEEETIKVKMMKLKEKFPYFVDSHLQCEGIMLPYKGKDLSMIILLPNLEKTSLTQLEQSLSNEKIKNISFNTREVELFLPKFKFDSSFSLNDQLLKLGMKDLFVEGKADMTGISWEGGLSVSKVVHKAFIEVNEEGSEAAAATGVMISTRCLSICHQLRVDHPFLFLIKDSTLNSILFMGKVLRPTISQS